MEEFPSFPTLTPNSFPIKDDESIEFHLKKKKQYKCNPSYQTLRKSINITNRDFSIKYNPELEGRKLI